MAELVVDSGRTIESSDQNEHCQFKHSINLHSKCNSEDEKEKKNLVRYIVVSELNIFQLTFVPRGVRNLVKRSIDGKQTNYTV